jgi:short-subunit dehydrogenase
MTPAENLRSRLPPGRFLRTKGTGCAILSDIKNVIIADLLQDGLLAGFQDNVIVITGASEGIGRALALQVAAEGAKLVLAGRNAARLDDCAHACRSAGAEACTFAGDLSDAGVCGRLINFAVESFGRIDTLINNAGITMWAMFQDTSDPALIQKVMQTNFMSAAYCTHFALPHLKKSQGRIAAVASLAGILGVPGHTIYGASKHAMFGFFNALRLELKEHKVSVTMVAPDFVRTEIHVRGLDANGEAMGKRLPEHHMSAEACAAMIRKAVFRRQRQVITSARGNLAFIMRDLIPWLVDAITARSVKKNSLMKH